MRNGTTSKQVSDVTEFPVTRIETISKGVIDWDRVGYLEKPEPAYRLEQGDILYSHINSVAHMGKVAIYSDLMPLYHGMNLMLLRPNREYVDPDFLFLLLSSEHARAYARRECKSAINQASLGQGEIKVLPVTLPPLYEQHCIAEILDTLDEAIQKTEQLIAKLKQIKQGLLHDLLTRGIDENGQLRDPIAHPEQFKDSVLGRIPLEWDVPRIRDIAVYVGSGVTPRGGSEVYRSEGVLFLRSQNIHFDGLHLDDVAYIDSRTHEQMSRSEVFPHDVLINITGASIGRCCAVPEGIGPTNVNQHVCAIRTAEPRKEDAKYFASVLTSYIGQSQIDRLNAGGNREGLNYEQLRSFSVPWPRQDERKRIAEVISAHDKRLSDEEEYLQKLGLEKKGLMHDLLTGKVRVNINREQG